MLICGDCRHVSWMKRPSEAELRNHYARQYDQLHNMRDQQEAGRAYYKTHLDFLAGFFSKKERLTLVDFGCSWPVLLEEALKNTSYESHWGIEPSTDAVAHGLALGIKMVTPDEWLSKVLDRSAHIIRFSHVLEHLPDPVETLNQAKTKLRPNGIVYITQPSFPVLKPNRPPQSLQDAVYPEHLHFFSPLSLSVALAKSGLRFLEFSAFQNEDKQKAHYQDALDLDYAKEKLAFLKARQPSYFKAEGTVPYFLGENIHAIAVLLEKS